MRNEKRYKAGIVGCGRIGCEFDDDPKREYIATHAGAYSKIQNTELSALCDIDEEKLNKYGNKFKVYSLYTDYNEMLEKENLDILSICTWNSTHLDIVKKAVECGIKAVFCEKPISNKLSNADEMIKICGENNVILQIDHQRRFDEFCQNVKKYIDEGNLGDIQQVSFYYTAGITNTGSHVFDLLRFFFGDIDWIFSVYSKNKSPNPGDPNIDGILKFKNGILCSVWACDVNDFLILEMDIIGTNGRIRITHSGFDMDFYEVKESNLFSGYKEIFRTKPPIDTEVQKNFMINGVQHIVDCLENGKESISSGVDGRHVLELICAFHESAINGGAKIKLPLKNSEIEVKSK